MMNYEEHQREVALEALHASSKEKQKSVMALYDKMNDIISDENDDGVMAVLLLYVDKMIAWGKSHKADKSHVR